MLTLGRRNDDSLARELEWFLSAEQNEITPASVWVLDDDETIRRRKVRVTHDGHSTAALDGAAQQAQEPQVLDDTADEVQESQALPSEIALTDLEELPEINPHVSVQDEDSFAKPVALPEITPHVSVRDEDSFAKPVPLPEINPHVSIRDEDSFAKPVALPQIDPHVSVRDEDSFAKPLPLPEINPHVSISDDASSSSPNSDASSHSIDEPQPPAGEPAYVTVSDGKKEKTFVQEYMGLSSSRSGVSSRDEDEPRALASESHEDELRPIVSSRVQKFDELRPVTKPKVHDLKPSRLIVNFPVQEKPPAVTPPVQHAPQPVVTPLVQNDPRPVVTPLVQSEPLPLTTRPVKLLDESEVLPGEASFATAIPNDSIGGHAHSPLHEFQAKTNLSLKTLLLASLLFVSIVAVSALVIVEATTGIFTSPQVAGSGESSASEPARPEILNGAKSVSPPVVAPPPRQETQAVASPRQYPKFPSGATARFPSESVQSTSRGTARDSNKNSDSSRNLRGTVHGRENSKTARANAKESGAKKPTNSKRSDVNKAHSKTGVSRSASNSGKDNAGVRIKVEVKTPTPPNANGAQRPRTVTRRNSIPGI